MNVARLPGILGLSAALAVFFCVSGCEEGPVVDEAASYFDNNPLEFTHTDISTYSLGIEWDDAELADTGLASDGEVALLSAGGGTPPYAWDVQDISLGTIIESGEASAVYQRNAVGDNVVILIDSAGDRAYTTVSQP